jgi:hypothetical protein
VSAFGVTGIQSRSRIKEGEGDFPPALEAVASTRKESIMKKKMKKLELNRETVLPLNQVAGGAFSENETMCGYTCYRQCQPVPSLDIAC